MKKILSFCIIAIILVTLTGCKLFYGDNLPIQEGTYIGLIDTSFYSDYPEIPENYYQNETASLVIVKISKDEYDQANGINVLKDLSRIRRHNHYRIELTIIFNDDRESTLVPLYFTVTLSHQPGTVYSHKDGYMKIEDDIVMIGHGIYIHSEMHRIDK